MCFICKHSNFITIIFKVNVITIDIYMILGKFREFVFKRVIDLSYNLTIAQKVSPAELYSGLINSFTMFHERAIYLNALKQSQTLSTPDHQQNSLENGASIAIASYSSDSFIS